MSLSIDQQKKLYNKLYDYIIDLHCGEFKKQLVIFTEFEREKGLKGIILLDYTNIKDMIASVKNKDFNYQWIPKNEASKIRHSGIPESLATANPKKDCIFVCSLSLSLKHLYVNCVKFRDITS